MENKTPCLPAHKDYLGRAVDCRTPKDAWFDMLDTCSGDRAIAQDRMESIVTPITITQCHEKAYDEIDQFIIGGEGGVSFKPHECAGLSGKLTINHYGCTAIKYRETIMVTKVMKITSIKCKKYEQDLCEYIVKCIKENKENKEEQVDQEKQSTNCNPKDRLEEYLSAAEKSKDPSSLLWMWQTVANACSWFLDERKSTHYVSGIKLGARQQESTDSKESGTKVAGGAGVNVCQGAGSSAQAQYQKGSNSSVSTKEERGEIDEHSGAVTMEEVIEATLTPLFELIEHKNLRKIMKELLRCYEYKGSKDGPFKIFCRDILSESKQEIYWQVINNKEIHVCGTTRVEEASTFYIKHTHTGKQFQIIHKIEAKHKTETKQTEMYVDPELQKPLKLVPGTTNQQKISFKLEDNKSENIDPPRTRTSWKEESPYFIQRPSISIITKYLYDDQRCLELCVEKKEHQRDDDEQPKYTVTAAKKRETESGLMLFYFIPAATLSNPPVSVQLNPRIQDDSSEVELAAGPPPPLALPLIQQQPECGSATGTDSPNELKDFFELVGEDYIFPIQVNAEV